jgi:hypothetical protein
MRLGKTCEMVNANDNCGRPRTANCGSCNNAQVCVANVCGPPACSSLTFGNQQPLVSVNASGLQDAVQAITPNGSSILFQRGTTFCAPYNLFLADEMPPGSGSYAAMDITGVAALGGMNVTAEQNLTMTADGKTLIGATTDQKHFVASTRSTLGQADFGAASGTDFAAISPTGSQIIGSPYVSPDGLAFYYVIAGDPDPNVNGIYEALRPAIGAPYPAGARMPDPVQQYSYVTATSSDRMALFVQDASFTMFVLTRQSLSAPFANPNAPNPPPMVPGWRTRPLVDCSKLIGTCNGGCPNEDTCSWTRM